MRVLTVTWSPHLYTEIGFINLRKIPNHKNELKEKGWSESDPPKITQPSFLRTDIGIDEPSHRLD